MTLDDREWLKRHSYRSEIIFAVNQKNLNKDRSILGLCGYAILATRTRVAVPVPEK